MTKRILKSRPSTRKPRHYCVIRVGLTPALQRQLLKYGRNNCVAARGNLNTIAEAALFIAMLHRKFIQNATNKIVRYAKAEGFAPSEYVQLIDSRLEANK